MVNRRKCHISLTIVLIIGFLLGLGSKSVLTAAPKERLIVGISSEPTSIDPSLTRSTADYISAYNWTEYIISRDPKGDIKPGLATSWKVLRDGMEIEFTLRKGVKFQSGDPMTARDIVFSFERARAKNPVNRVRLKSVERIEIIDDFHLKVHFKEPDVVYIVNLGGCPIVSKSYYDRVGEDGFIRRPIGTTAPYKVVRYVPGEYVDIERFEEYWGEKPSVKEARFYFVNEGSTRVAKLKTGEVDIINNVPYPNVKDIEKSSGLKTVKFLANHPTPSIVFGNRNPNTPWHDRRVRLAMAYAIDCNAIIKLVLYGFPKHWAYLAPYELGYDPNLKPYPYDPKKAKELLAEAGYPQGFNLTLYWPITGYVHMGRETVEAIAAYLEAVGIRIKLVGEEYLASLQRRTASKKPEAEFVGFAGVGRSGQPDPSYSLDLYFSLQGPFSSYYNPELDKLIDEARKTMNDAKRAELIKKGVRTVHEEVASIPIYNMVPIYAMKMNIDIEPTLKQPHDLVLVKDVTIR